MRQPADGERKTVIVLLGALLIASGADQFFTDLARALTGRTVGGPAKTAITTPVAVASYAGAAVAAGRDDG